MADAGNSQTLGSSAVTKEFAEHESRGSTESGTGLPNSSSHLLSSIDTIASVQSSGGYAPDISESIDASTFLNISRILQGTVASQAKYANPTSTAEASTPTPSQTQSANPTITAEAPTPTPSQPPQVPSRILQDTEASVVRVVNSPVNAKKGDHRFEELKEIVHSHTEEQRRKDAEAAERLRLINEEKKKKQIENSMKLQSSLDRARERKEQADKIEQERLEQVKERLKEKSSRRPTQQARKPDLRPLIPKQEKPSVTIPIEPHFATDLRLGPKPSPLALNDPPSMAQGEDILRRALRSEFDSCTPKHKSASAASEGPNTSGSTPHGSKTHPGVVEVSSFDSSSPIYLAPSVERAWHSSLRVPAGTDQKDMKVTTPVAPKFHAIHKRELSKSTEEREAEMMEYYRKHPFKATPIKRNDSPSKPATPSPSKSLTTPEPFHFRTDARIRPSDHPKGPTPSTSSSRKEAKPFKARPMPDFSRTHTLNLLGLGLTPPRTNTRPQPFHFHSVSRSSARTPSTNVTTSSKTTGKSKGPRHLPDFDRLARPRQLHLPPEPKIKQFKARPMPTFCSSPSPLSVNYRFTHKTSQPTVKESVVPKFKARPLPDFSKEYMPVYDRDPTKLRPIPNKELRQRIMSPNKSELGRTSNRSSPGFKARPLPDFSKQSIPVHNRDPSKIRLLSAEQRKEIMKPISLKRLSPEYKAQHSPKLGSPPNQNSNTRLSLDDDTESLSRSVFRARPLPDFSRQMIPVRDRDPLKLKTPRKTKSPFEKKEKTNERDTWFTAKPGADPFLTFLK